jgi:glycosyltransferase involved in cell wall biosynthesis
VVPIKRNLVLPLRLLRVVSEIVREGRFADVVFVNGLFMESVLANFILRKPLVFKVVGDWAWERGRNKGWTVATFDRFQQDRRGDLGRVAVLQWLRNYTLRRAGAIIVPSRFLARVVEDWGVVRDRIHVIYNGAELPHDGHRTEIPLKTSRRVISVGRLVRWKHVDQLIQTLRSWPDDIGLIVVGDGPQKQELLDLARQLDVDHRVWFAGTRRPAEVASLLTQSDVFVLNSSYEGLPHVVIEAMLAGVPVIATAAGGTAEAVTHGETGILLPTGDAEGLRRAVLELLHDSDRRREMVARAHAVAGTRFATDTMIRETESTLSAAAAHGRANQRRPRLPDPKGSIN